MIHFTLNLDKHCKRLFELTIVLPERLITAVLLAARDLMGDLNISAQLLGAESTRLETLDRLRILDTEPEPEFNDLVDMACAVCGTPAAAISLVDAHRQWFKASIGIPMVQTRRDEAVCSTAIATPRDLFCVHDLAQDPRFQDFSYVRSDPAFRFYAGMPLSIEEGSAVGTICVFDVRPRRLDARQQSLLRTLARVVSDRLAWRAKRLEASRVSISAHLPSYFADQVVSQSQDLISYVDQDYIYRFVNTSYLEYWATKPEYVIGCAAQELSGQAFFQSKAKAMFDRAFRGEGTSFEATVVFPKLGSRRMRIQHLPAYGEDGFVVGAIVRATDIHRFWEQQAQLSETVALLERQTLNQQRFIHMLSHDLREPVNTISNFIGLVTDERDPLSNDDRDQGLAYIQSSAERMKELINDLLHWIRLDESQVRSGDVTHEIFSLNAVMEDVQADLNCAIQKAGVELRAESLGFIVGNRTLIRVLIQNLVGNAIKFVAPGKVPRVWVWREECPDEVAIRVQDNGIGVSSDEIRRLFEPFRRLNNRRQYPGSGLGLSICRRIAELHQGRIEVESEPTVGSTFSVVLPRLAATGGLVSLKNELDR